MLHGANSIHGSQGQVAIRNIQDFDAILKVDRAQKLIAWRVVYVLDAELLQINQRVDAWDHKARSFIVDVVIVERKIFQIRHFPEQIVDIFSVYIRAFADVQALQLRILFGKLIELLAIDVATAGNV